MSPYATQDGVDMACPLADQRADVVTRDKTLVQMGAQQAQLFANRGEQRCAFIQCRGKLRLGQGYAHVCCSLTRRRRTVLRAWR